MYTTFFEHDFYVLLKKNCDFLNEIAHSEAGTVIKKRYEHE